MILRTICLSYLALFCYSSLASATQQEKSEEVNHLQESQTHQPDVRGPIEVLTDTGGADLRSYVNQVPPTVKANWYKQIPANARAPIMKKGMVSISFRVFKDGSIANLQYGESSGDISLDRAAFEAIIHSNPLPKLPSEFKCQFLDLRFTFLYNPTKNDLPGKKSPSSVLVPCVTSKISLIGPFTIAVSPDSVHVAPGATQQFLAAVTGDVHSTVSWSVRGLGCEASGCGVISSAGLYTAPLTIPDPPTIIITAVPAVDPAVAASGTITIVQSGPSH